MNKTMLIADSGSTKTDWRVIAADTTVSQAKTVGFNPYYQHPDEIYDALKKELLPQIKSYPDEIQFYGAGCAEEKNAKLINEALRKVFPEAEIHIFHDLLAAARALCGKEPGIACILGTGSNSCFYDGEKIVKNIPSLGFTLGDEGSGGHLGKQVLRDFLNNTMPEDLHNKFQKRYRVTHAEVLENIYKQPFPNRYAASFSKFLFDNLKTPYVNRIVTESFKTFLRLNVLKYDNYRQYPVHFVGSVAFYYNAVLQQIASEYDFTIGRIIESPIAGLTLYHQG